MKNRITTTLAVTITALGLAGLPTLASADSNRHRDGVFNAYPQHGDRQHERRDHDRHGGHRDRQDRHDDYGHDRHRKHHGHHYGHRKHHNHGHHYGHSKHYGHGPQHGYYRDRHDHHYGHGSHISGYYVDPFLGLKVIIH